MRRRFFKVFKQTFKSIFSFRLSNSFIFNDIDKFKFENWNLRIQEQSFFEFYTEFIKYVVDDQSQKRYLIKFLKENIIKRLKETHIIMNIERD